MPQHTNSMSDQELISHINALKVDTVQYSGEYAARGRKNLKYYLGEPFGNEVPGRSQAVSTDVQDVIEDDMPQVVEALLSSDEIMEFEPTSDSKEDIEEARIKTKYINYLVKHQEDSFATLHGWFKDALIQPISVVKYFAVDETKTREVELTGLDDLGLAEQQQALSEEEGVESVEIVGTASSEDVEGKFDVRFKVTSGKQRIVIAGIKPENFRVSRYAETLDDAELVGDDEIVTRGDLVEQGYSKEIVDSLPRASEDNSSNTYQLNDIRHRSEGGTRQATEGNSGRQWANEEVLVENLYVKIDKDGDGIAERRYIRKSGNTILEDEAFDHVPYAALSSILMPNKLIGRSRAELVLQTQEQKSALLRGALDNTYSVNNPRIAANDTVNKDDLTNIVWNGIIRAKGEANPGQSIFPVTVPFVADKSLLVVNYLDQQRANRTGALTSSQGLNADDFSKETATRFDGVESAGKRKIKLIVRVWAETGLRKLFNGLLWTVNQNQDRDMEIRIAGEQIKFDPSLWKYKHTASPVVGLAVADDDESLGNLSAVLQDQLNLQANGSPLVDQVKLFNTRRRLVKATKLGATSDFYNDPDRPEELVTAQNEILAQQVQLLTQQLQQMQNPLAEVEQIKAQAGLIKAQSQAQIDAAKIAQDATQFQQKLAEEQRQFNATVLEKLTELELKYNQDVPGSAV